MNLHINKFKLNYSSLSQHTNKPVITIQWQGNWQAPCHRCRSQNQQEKASFIHVKNIWNSNESCQCRKHRLPNSIIISLITLQKRDVENNQTTKTKAQFFIDSCQAAVHPSFTLFRKACDPHVAGFKIIQTQAGRESSFKGAYSR